MNDASDSVPARRDTPRGGDEQARSAHRLRGLIDTLAAFVGLTTLDGTLIEANRAALEAAGLTPEDVLGKPFWEAYWWSYDERVQAELQHAIARAAAGEAVQYDVPVRARDGMITIEFRIAPLRDAAGRITHLVPSAVNVTDRVSIERELRVREERQRFLLTLHGELRHLADPVEVEAVAARLLGEHLEADRVMYGSVDPSLEGVTVHSDYRREGVASAAGRYRFADFGTYVERTMRAGRSLVVHDTREVPDLGRDERAAFAAIGLRAFVGAPLVKAGRLVGYLSVHQTVARAWTDDEVALVEEVAEHTWAAVERAQAEWALRESELRYRALFENAAVGVGRLALDGRVLEVNDRYCEITGRTREQLLSTTFRSITHPEDVAQDARQAAALAAGEIDEYKLDKRYLRPDGGSVWVRVSVAPLRDLEGRPEALVAVAEDITLRKEAERKERRAHALLAGIATGTEDLIAAEDQDFRYTFFNDAYREEFERLWGRDLEVGTSMVEALAPWPEEQRKARELWARALAGESFSVTEEFGPREDERQVYDLRFNPLRDERGTVVGAAHILRNVTERVEMEEALRDLNETLEQRVSTRTRQVWELAASLSRAEQSERARISQVLHDDVQQHLYSVRMKLAQALDAVRDERSIPETLLQDLGDASAWTRDAIHVTRNLTVDLNPPVLRDEGLAHSLAWLASQMESLHGLEVRLDAARSETELDWEVRLLVFQLVRELLFNVVKHAGVQRARVTLREEEDRLCAEVEDHGSGFISTPPTSDALGRSAPETGFGLASVRERLGYLGGEMGIETAPDEGTTVTLCIPLGPRTS